MAISEYVTECVRLFNVHDMLAHGKTGRKTPLRYVMAVLGALGLSGCAQPGGDDPWLSLANPQNASHGEIATRNGEPPSHPAGAADMARPGASPSAPGTTSGALHDPRTALLTPGSGKKAQRPAPRPQTSDGKSAHGPQTGLSSLARLKRRLDAAFTPSVPSPEERQRLGDMLAKKVLSNARLARDAALQKRIGGIVHRLAAAARKENAWPRRWHVHVIDDPRADAFTSGGGHLFITTGMVELLQTDERLATVLAHEMAHNLLRHVWEARKKKEMARKAHEFSHEVLARKWRMPWLGKSVSFVVNTSLNTYSRQQEYDADAEGLHLLIRAGYPPRAALETFDFLKRHFHQGGALENFFYDHHPLYERRRWYLANRIRAHYRAEAGLPPVRRANWRRGR